DLVDGEEGPVAHHEGLGVGLPGDAALELLGALREVIELLELGAPLRVVHYRPLTLPSPRRGGGYMPLKTQSAAISRNAFSWAAMVRSMSASLWTAEIQPWWLAQSTPLLSRAHRSRW